MTIVFAVGAAVLAVACAIGHSVISERAVLGPLYAEACTGLLDSRAMRDIIRVVFHIPSVAWAVLGVAVVVARLQGGNPPISVVAIVIFTTSGLGNLAALRSPHPGGLLLLGAAALTLADLMISEANRSPH